MTEPPPSGHRRLVANPFVFFGSAGLVVGGVGAASYFGKRAATFFEDVLGLIAKQFGWLYVLTVAGFLLFSLWLMMGPYARVRLGRDDDRPEFGRLTWFAMLFSAGMGIGLLFFGVAEPMMHFANPPDPVTGPEQAARQAMLITFFHWGLHAWGIYAVVGLSLGYFCFRNGLPLSMRSFLHPFIGRRMYGRAGDVIDLLAVFATLFGLATSLGLGALQINAGLGRVFGIEQTTNNQVIIIVVITLAATGSVVTGLHTGIRRLSELNVGLAGCLLLFVFLAGPTLFLLDSFADNLSYYLRSLVYRTFFRDAFRDDDWQASWTLFYWAWWVSWSPFVGMFIARVSKGRTIREFVLGVLFIPTLTTFVWLTVFGGTALHLELFEQAKISDAVSANSATAIFAMLDQLPFSGIVAPITALLVATFFVTSSDSGSLVVDMLTSGGDPDPPVWQRIFWAMTEGAVAAGLLLAGGLKALQSAAISAGLPLAVIVCFMCVGLVRALKAERRAKSESTEAPVASTDP